METHFKILGWLFIPLSLIHAFFPRYFRWRQELAPLSLINRQMMYAHMFFIALVVLLMGMLCIGCSYDLLHTELGRWLSLGMAIFWGARLLFQFFVYSPKLWRGKLFETAIHIVFSLLWTYATVVFSMAYIAT